MYKQILNVVTALALAGFSAGHVWANNVGLGQPNPVVVTTQPTVEINVLGTNFTDEVDAAGFTVRWDPAILQYNSTTVASAWASSSINDASAATSGVIDWIFLDLPLGESLIGDFALVGLRFSVIGAPGSSTTITISDICLGCGFYRNGTLVAATYVPVPPAAWLMLSGLLGLAGVARRRSS